MPAALASSILEHERLPAGLAKEKHHCPFLFARGASADIRANWLKAPIAIGTLNAIQRCSA
jgi:hypothetical protein